jgi:hypothetical protein
VATLDPRTASGDDIVAAITGAQSLEVSA